MSEVEQPLEIRLLKAASVIYVAVDKDVADSISGLLQQAANALAAANPETIKGLIAELEAKEAEVEALKKLLGRIVSNPRWCSIGVINSVAEIRISKEDYEQVLEGIKTGDA